MLKRWLMLALGLGFAAIVGYAVLTAAPEQPARPAVSTRAAEPSDHIDRESRDAMRDLLREADDRESP